MRCAKLFFVFLCVVIIAFEQKSEMKPSVNFEEKLLTKILPDVEADSL